MPRSEVTVPLSVTSQFAYAPLDFFARFLRAISPGTSFHQKLIYDRSSSATFLAKSSA